ncbi:MAG: response regulator transcription factor, partial [Candidatus Moranbacteria bacterium]|nr:response regulator transcription factor [Candidatus Moranbacteria bacterium]
MENNNVIEGEKILIAEDDEFIRDIYSRIFTMNGFEVILATNGAEAL